MDKIPVLPAFKLGSDLVIAVDISSDLENLSDFRRGVDIMVRANSIKDVALAGHCRRVPARDALVAERVRADRVIRQVSERPGRAVYPRRVGDASVSRRSSRGVHA